MSKFEEGWRKSRETRKTPMLCEICGSVLRQDVITFDFYCTSGRIPYEHAYSISLIDGRRKFAYGHHLPYCFESYWVKIENNAVWLWHSEWDSEVRQAVLKGPGIPLEDIDFDPKNPQPIIAKIKMLEALG